MFHVIIPSASAGNLVRCVTALQAAEPDLPAANIVIVDDGARADAAPLLPGVTWVDGIKPFNFARNSNLGLCAAAAGAFLLNDDALLETPHGFSLLAAMAGADPRVGLCSAAIDGAVGNPDQCWQGVSALRNIKGNLAFVCVYLPAPVRARIGPLDERFAGYGFEDDDYSCRVRHAGLRLVVWDGCRVRHDGSLPSTFRSRPDYDQLFAQNAALFAGKAQPPPPVVAEWPVRIVIDRTSLPAAAFHRPAFWYIGFHDAAGTEIARADAELVELHAQLAGGADPVIIDRRVRTQQPPARWTVWPVDRHRRWLQPVHGAFE
jgi:hypothetical protein